MLGEGGGVLKRSRAFPLGSSLSDWSQPLPSNAGRAWLLADRVSAQR